MSKLQQYRLVEDRPQGLVRRVADSIRSYWRGPYNLSTITSDYFGAGTGTATGVNVSEITALNYAAVWSAVNLISSDVASLPLVLYKRLNDDGREKFVGHPLYRLLHDRPNPEMTSVNFRKVLQAHALTWHGGFAEIERDGADRPVGLWPLTPDRVQPFRRGVDAPLEYRVQNPSGSETIFAQRDILHISGLGWDGTTGYSIIGKARESIGVGVAAERFGGTFFGNGSTFGGVLSYPGPKPPELSDKNYVDSIKRRHQGVEKAHQLLSLYNDAKYTQLGVPPNDAQFLETRQFQITEIARWFNVPPHKIGDLTRATFSNIEQQSIDYYTTTLIPWLTVWEQELAFKLIAASEQNIQFIEHVADGLLRGDAAGRAASYTAQFNVGGIMPNEIRASENRNKVKGGDRAFVQLNMVPLDRVDEIIDADIKAKNAKAEAPKLQGQVENLKNALAATQRLYDKATEERDLARKVSQQAEDAKDIANARLTEVTVEALQATEALAAARAAQATESTQVEAEAQRLAQELTRAAGDVRAGLTQITQLEVDCARVGGERDALAAERDTAAARALALAGDLQRAEETLTARALALAEVSAERESLLASVAAKDAAAAARAGELSAEQAAHIDTRAERDAALEQAETHARAIAPLVAERDQLLTAIATNEAVTVELRTQVTTLTADRQAGIDDVVAVRVELASTQLQRDDALAARTAAEQAREQAERAVAGDRMRDAAVLSAHRGLLADAMGRMVRRELAKAKNYRATPSKLGTWLETFYDDTERAIFREALLPSVRTHLAWIGSADDPVAVTERLVTGHFDESQAKLTAIVDGGQDGFADVLQRTFDRWDSERADRFADRVVREEMTGGH